MFLSSVTRRAPSLPCLLLPPLTLWHYLGSNVPVDSHLLSLHSAASISVPTHRSFNKTLQALSHWSSRPRNNYKCTSLTLHMAQSLLSDDFLLPHVNSAPNFTIRCLYLWQWKSLYWHFTALQLNVVRDREEEVTGKVLGIKHATYKSGMLRKSQLKWFMHLIRRLPGKPKARRRGQVMSVIWSGSMSGFNEGGEPLSLMSCHLIEY